MASRARLPPRRHQGQEVLLPPARQLRHRQPHRRPGAAQEGFSTGHRVVLLWDGLKCPLESQDARPPGQPGRLAHRQAAHGLRSAAQPRSNICGPTSKAASWLTTCRPINEVSASVANGATSRVGLPSDAEGRGGGIDTRRRPGGLRRVSGGRRRGTSLAAMGGGVRAPASSAQSHRSPCCPGRPKQRARPSPAPSPTSSPNASPAPRADAATSPAARPKSPTTSQTTCVRIQYVLRSRASPSRGSAATVSCGPPRSSPTRARPRARPRAPPRAPLRARAKSQATNPATRPGHKPDHEDGGQVVAIASLLTG